MGTALNASPSSSSHWQGFFTDVWDTVGGVIRSSQVVEFQVKRGFRWGQIAVGRAPLPLGISPLWGLLNVLSPVSPLQLDPVFVPGVDGVWLRVYPRMDMEAMGWFHADSTWFLQGRWEGMHLSLGVLGGRFYHYLRFGGYGEYLRDPLRFWVESYHQTPPVSDTVGRNDWGIEVGGQWMKGRQEIGLSLVRYAFADNKSPQAFQALSQRGLRLFQGQSYALISFGWHGDRNRIKGVGIGNLDDGSALGQMFWYRDLSDQQDVAVWVTVGIRSASGGEFGSLAWGMGVFWEWVEGL